MPVSNDIENHEIEIREAGDADAARIVELSMGANPTIVNTPEVWLHRQRTRPARARALWLVAERDGVVVAHRVDEEATLDEPSPETIPGFPYDEWLESLWRRPDLTHDGSFAALDAGLPVAFAMLYVAPAPGRAVNGFTATLRAHRARGLAYACKGRVSALGGGERDHRGRDGERRHECADARDQPQARLRADRPARNDAPRKLERERLARQRRQPLRGHVVA